MLAEATTVTITRLGHKGDGVAEGPIFAPLTLPGEVVRGTLEGDRLVDPRIVTPSPDRVSAPCALFKRCGGCQMQHGSDAFVAGWKTSLIRSALEPYGIDAPMRPILTSPAKSRRRAVFAGRRSKKGAMVGFHARRSDMIVPLDRCELLHPDLLACIPDLEEITKLGGSRSATLAFAVTRSETGLDCQVRGGKPLDGALRQSLPQFRTRFTRLTWEEEPIFTDAPPRLTMGGAALTPPPGAFLQATEQGEAALVAAVLEALSGAQSVVDLFSGCGTFGLPIAAQAPVHAVEGADDLLQALDQAARFATGLKKITTEARDLFRRPLEPDELSKFDAVVIDPPRAGAEAQTQALAQAQVPRIAMVSCNPITFARDAALLIQAGYRLNWVQPVDQFRWSTHVELAASLSLPHVTGE